MEAARRSANGSAKSVRKHSFINGLRVTDEETMEIAEMVLGRVNKSLVTMVEELGVKAVGISGKDGGLLKGREEVLPTDRTSVL